MNLITENNILSNPPSTEWLKRRIECPCKGYLWGVSYWIKPRLVSEVFGDGRQLIYIEPLNTRPNYYVVRIDSAWGLDDDLRDHLDDIYEKIEEQFGMADPDGNESASEPWPAFDDLVGSSWGIAYWPEDRNQLRLFNGFGQIAPEVSHG